MNKITKNQAGFSIVEIALVLVMLGLIGIVGFTAYSNHKMKVEPVVNATTTQSTPASTSAPASSHQYLTVKEFGIKIALVSSISDLSYVYSASGGYKGLPYVTLGSRTLAQEAMKDDPVNCTQDRLDQTNGLYPISYVYSTKWGLDSGEEAVKSITLGGKSYYWYQLHSGFGCDVSGTMLTNDFTTYYNTVLASFSSSVAK